MQSIHDARLIQFSGALLIMIHLVSPSGGIEYPKTERIDHVDNYHGTTVADPYRWLEEDVRESERVAQWVQAQNKITFGYLESIPARGPIQRRLTELWDYERFSSPFKRGGRYYFFKNDGLQNQAVLFAQSALEDEPRVLMDPNQWSEDGTVALKGLAFSDGGKYVAYGVSSAGSDWSTWQVMEIETGRILDDRIEWMKFGSPTWTKNEQGFFYSRFKEPNDGDEFQSLNLDQTVYYHHLGNAQVDDEVVHREPDHPDWGYMLDVTEDGRYLILAIWKGTDDKYRVMYRDLQSTDKRPVNLIDHFENEYSFVGNVGSLFYFQTDLDAPKGRILAIDIKQPEPANWQSVIPEAEETLSSVSLVNDSLVASYLKDAKTVVKIVSREGIPIRDVEFPTIGSANGFAGRHDDTETFYSFSSFATPPSIYRYDLESGESTLLRQAKVDFDSAQFVEKQVFYESRDGTRIPMFLAHRRGIELDGTNPTLLYGYGGFAISLTPSFSVARVAWMEMGGVFAMPNLRGGGEYGEQWHQGGTKLNKQNVFDDFVAAAEWLVDEGYTSPPKLAIQGGSNGGLLVGACMTQRPELFGACLPAVGVMDMLRFHQFTSGRYWVDDYGSAEDPDQFKALLAYSPYHNLQSDTAYPPTMVTTADTDDRVVPGHSFKFAAALQHGHRGPAPVLIRVETKAGHGAGTPTSKRIEEAADAWAFLVNNLKMEVNLD